MHKEVPGREHWIDALKGFAILLVVAGHVANGYMAAGKFRESISWLYGIYTSVYTFHMPLFFILSGYLFSRIYVHDDPADLPKKFHRKVSDLTIVYVLWSILFGGMKIAASRFVSNQVSVMDLLRIPFRAIDHFWYLYVLIFCYILSYLLRSILRKNTVSFAGILAVSLASCLLFCLIGKDNSFTIVRLAGYFFYFLLGIGLEQNRTILSVLKKPAAVLLLLAAGAVIAVLFGKGPSAAMVWNRYGIFGPLLPVLLSAGWIGLFLNLPSCPTLEYLGRSSLVVYILHNFCIAICRAVLPKIGVHGFWPSVILSLILAVTLPLIFLWISQKLGIYKLLFSPLSFLSERKYRK